MMLPQTKLRRLDRAEPKEKPWKFNLREALRDLPPAPLVLAERARREAEAAGVTEQAARPPEPAEAADPKPSAPPTPPPEPKWYEEKCQWRARDAIDPYVDDMRYETIHSYDPLEWALGEEEHPDG
jgi:hypothetical protein